MYIKFKERTCNVNECHFMGLLTRDPQLRKIDAKGTSVVNFGIAINRKYKRSNGEADQETTFLECEAWDTGGELINQYFTKGDPIIIHASAKTDSWETPEGQKRSRIKFRVNKFEFVPGKKNTSHSNTSEAKQESVPSPANAEGETDEEIPF